MQPDKRIFGRRCSCLVLCCMALVQLLPLKIVRAAPEGEIRDQAPVERVLIAGRPISDLQGNVVGVTIPLKRAGRLLLLEGSIGGMVGNFILDTGSSDLVLNKTYFRGNMTFHNEEGGGVTGTTASVKRMVVKELKVSELIYTNVSADVIPLGHIENRRGVKILGLFGMSLLKNVEIVIDVTRNELQVFSLDKAGKRLGNAAPWVKYDITQKLVEFHNVLFVKAMIGGKELDFCLDTGAESNVLSIDAGRKVLGTVTITRRSTLSGSGAGLGEVLYGTLNEFSMGNLQMVPMETVICSLVNMAQKYGYPIDGMLGYDFFSKGRIYINLVKKEMGICLNREDRK